MMNTTKSGAIEDTKGEIQFPIDLRKFNSTNWMDARTYCDQLTFAGYSDWRLPTLHEMEYILSKWKKIGQTLFKMDKKVLFPSSFLNGWFWTSIPASKYNFYFIINLLYDPDEKEYSRYEPVDDNNGAAHFYFLPVRDVK